MRSFKVKSIYMTSQFSSLKKSYQAVKRGHKLMAAFEIMYREEFPISCQILDISCPFQSQSLYCMIYHVQHVNGQFRSVIVRQAVQNSKDCQILEKPLICTLSSLVDEGSCTETLYVLLVSLGKPFIIGTPQKHNQGQHVISMPQVWRHNVLNSLILINCLICFCNEEMLHSNT